MYSSGGNTTTKGSFEWHNTSSDGSADTIGMKLDASGNLGIGTTTPNSAGLGANGQTLQLGARTFIATDSSVRLRLLCSRLQLGQASGLNP
jgi:hypothetical protein